MRRATAVALAGRTGTPSRLLAIFVADDGAMLTTFAQ